MVWWRDNGSGQKDLYGRQLDSSGQLLGSTFTILEQGDVQDNPAVIGAGGGRFLLAWQDDRNGSWDIYASLYQQEQNPATVISYTYDPLYRLTNAVYAGTISATYEYLYDAVGNRTAYTQTITSTQVTTYTYNDANQLVTAKLNTSSDKWYYEFDGNGNQIRQVPNSLTPAEGEVRYTFNQRNQLIRIENHDGSDYEVQAEAVYDGNSRRLQLIVYVASMPMTTTYTMDVLEGVPLVAGDSAGDTLILYGLFGLGEYGTEWHYYLGDGQFSVRQLVDDSGGLILAQTYEPFGRVLEQAGSDGSQYGFAGSLSGGGSLLYRDGRYYDPSTGRFLSPDHNFDPKRPSQGLNPYLVIFLANPIGLLVPPVVVLYWRRRKGKKGLPPGLWFLILCAITISLAACERPEEDDDDKPNPVEIETPAPLPQPSTVNDIINRVRTVESKYSFIELDTVVNVNEYQWWTIPELNTLEIALRSIVAAMGNNPAKAERAFNPGGNKVQVIRDRKNGVCSPDRAFTRFSDLSLINTIVLCDIVFYEDYLVEPEPDILRPVGGKDAEKTIIHEFGHVWDNNTGDALSSGIPLDDPGIFCGGTRLEASPNSDNLAYMDYGEEWADSFALWVLVKAGRPIDVTPPFDRPKDPNYPWPAHQAYVQRHVDGL